MTPEMANFSGNALLNLLDRVAFSQPSRYSGRYTVTLSVDQVTFKGELVTFRASVNHVGRTSMEIGIRVEAENIQQGTVRHTNSCYFTWWPSTTMGRPVECQTYTSKLRTDARRNRAAELRRKIRREIAAELERAAEGVE